MIMNRRAFALLPIYAVTVAALAATPTLLAQSLSADDIVNKHLAAVGGKDALAKITTRRATGVMVVGTPMGDLSGPVEMVAKAPNKMRMAVSMDLSALGAQGEIHIEQLFDGTTGWTMNSMQGDQQLAGEQLDSAKNGYFPSPLLDYVAHGFSIALEPREQVNGRDAYVINLKPKTGNPSKLFFDAETFMLVRTTGKVSNPQLGDVESVSEPSDYRDVNGVKVAFTMFQSAGGQNITMKFAKVEHNVPVEDALFVKK